MRLGTWPRNQESHYAIKSIFSAVVRKRQDVDFRGVYGYDKYGMDPSEWYARGQRAGPAATKYRKGACENCGAMTHRAKECLDRPRKLGARFTGKDIQDDEVIRNFYHTF